MIHNQNFSNQKAKIGIAVKKEEFYSLKENNNEQPNDIYYRAANQFNTQQNTPAQRKSFHKQNKIPKKLKKVVKVIDDSFEEEKE